MLFWFFIIVFDFMRFGYFDYIVYLVLDFKLYVNYLVRFGIYILGQVLGIYQSRFLYRCVNGLYIRVVYGLEWLG